MDVGLQELTYGLGKERHKTTFIFRNKFIIIYTCETQVIMTIVPDVPDAELSKLCILSYLIITNTLWSR